MSINTAYLLLGSTNGIQQMPKFRFGEGRVLIPEEVDGIGEKKWIIVISCLNIMSGTVTFLWLVQTEHLSILLSLSGNRRNLYFLGSMLCEEMEDRHLSYDFSYVLIYVSRTFTELIETIFELLKRG